MCWIPCPATVSCPCAPCPGHQHDRSGLGPPLAFLPLTILYGIGLGLLYPLLAATIYDRSTDATRSINSNVMMLTFDASGCMAPCWAAP